MLLQSCLTLCDPMDCSLPGSSVHGISQARILEWVAISFSNAWKWKVKVKSLSRVRLSDPMDCSLPGSSVHGIFQARVLEWGAIAFSKTGGRSWNSWAPGGGLTNQTPGLATFHGLQDKTTLLKKKKKINIKPKSYSLLLSTTHSSTLAWKIPWTEEPGRLQSMGLQRVGHNWVTSRKSIANDWTTKAFAICL